jgi:hypothetical protein
MDTLGRDTPEDEQRATGDFYSQTNALFMSRWSQLLLWSRNQID